MNSLLRKDLAKKQKFMAFYGVWNLYCEAIFYDLLFLAVRVMCFKTVFMPNKPPFNSVLRAFTFTRILLIRVSFKCAKPFFIHSSISHWNENISFKVSLKVYLFWAIKVKMLLVISQTCQGHLITLSTKFFFELREKLPSASIKGKGKMP